MLPERIYAETWEVEARLVPFRITRAELIEVAKKTLAERSNTIDADIAGAAGTLAYLHGSRHLRLLALSKGYELSREKNIESSVDPKSGIMIAYQNVDVACSKRRSPRAIHGKKSGSADIIDRAQGSLFPPDVIPESVDLSSIRDLNSTVWYFCVSFQEDSFSAELSLPASLKGDNFNGFFERIFIAQGQEWFGKPAKTTSDDYAEIEPQIKRN